MIEVRHKITGEIIRHIDPDALTHHALWDSDLSYADLIRVELRGADLSGADLSHACLSGADLSFAKIYASNLVNADLTGTLLYRTDITLSDLHEANLAWAETGHTTFSFCPSLRLAKGLDKIDHHGPSNLDRETLQSCIEDLPDVFLLGVGYTEEEITTLRDLYSKAKPIQFFSCFISYSHKDEEFAKRLHARMQQAGLRVWIASQDMQGGKKIHEQVNQAIQVHDRLLLVLSENSLSSEWVQTEIRRARKIEREQNRRKLFPIRLLPFDPAIRKWECFDSDSGKDLGVELREYFIPDFEDWKHHDQFEAGFEKLLKDLKAEEKTV